MATKQLDTIGLRCPQPVLKITVMVPELQPGDILEVKADCPTFENDLRLWCERMSKTLVSVVEDDGVKTAQIHF